MTAGDDIERVKMAIWRASMADDESSISEREADLFARAALAAAGPGREETLIEALTPSADTKAAYIGEFGFRVELTDVEGETYSQPFTVPWTTIKEIMAAIRKRAEDQP